MNRREAFKKIGGLFAGLSIAAVLPKDNLLRDKDGKVLEMVDQYQDGRTVITPLEAPPLSPEMYDHRQRLMGSMVEYIGCEPHANGKIEGLLEDSPKQRESEVICEHCTKESGITTFLDVAKICFETNKTRFECPICKINMAITHSALRQRNVFVAYDIPTEKYFYDKRGFLE